MLPYSAHLDVAYCARVRDAVQIAAPAAEVWVSEVVESCKPGHKKEEHDGS